LRQAVEGALPTLITTYFEDAAASDSNLDPVPFFQFERLKPPRRASGIARLFTPL